MKDRGPGTIARSPLALALLLALLGSALPCAAASRLDANLGFGGYSSPLRWLPLRIRCEGSPRDASIRIRRLAADGRGIGEETFPASDGISLESPVWMSAELESLSVSLVSRGRALAEATVDARAKAFPGHIVLACGLSTAARLAIASALLPLEPILAISTEAADLPANGLDYDAVSAVAVGTLDVELSSAQREALLAWMSGGGRLCAIADTGGGGGILAALALEERSASRSAEGHAYGLGRYISLAPDRAEAPPSWRDALALVPYDSSRRMGSGSAANGPEPGEDSRLASRETRAIIRAAIAAWLVATLLAAACGKRRALPIAGVAALCLAAVLSGASTLDGAFARGAGARALALVLPESGSAFLSLRARAYLPPSGFDWAESRAIGNPAIASSDAESGSFGEWRHSLAKAAFSLRASSDRALDLEGMLSPEEWNAVSASASSFARSWMRRARGGTEPPHIESAYPLAFLASGEPVSWWTKVPGQAWVKSDSPPALLKDEAQWMLALRGAKRGIGLLAGSCPGDSLSISVEGRPLREIRWAMPLPGAEE